MRHVAGSLVLFKFLCCVQCRWNQIVTDIDLAFSNPKVLNTSNQGWHPPDREHLIQSVPTSPVSRPMTKTHTWLVHNSHSGRRTRRQVFQSKTPNTVEVGGFRWTHVFTTNSFSMTSNEKDHNIWQENMKSLKTILEKTEIQFINPVGLRISISGDSINMRIVDLRFKLNEPFRENDGGHYAPSGDKSGGRWTYAIPELYAKQGDKIYYWMHVKFDKDGFDVIVNGVVEITLGNPHNGGTQMIPITPVAVPDRGPPPQTSGVGSSPTLGGGLGGTGGLFKWSHKFNINPVAKEFASQEIANSWRQSAQLLKSTWDNNFSFQFVNPSGIKILIPEPNINMKIVDFRLKYNEDFHPDDGGHFAPKGEKMNGRWIYDIPQLKLKQGDKVYQWMHIKLGTEEFDAIAKGVLEITQGNPHTMFSIFQNTKLPPPIEPSPQSPLTEANPWLTSRPPPKFNPPTNPTGQPWYTTSPSTQTSSYWTFPSQTPPSCTAASQSSRNGVSTGLCEGDVLLDHRFNTLNGWTHQVTIGGTYPEDEFTYFTIDRENANLRQGKLVIKPSLLEEKYNPLTNDKYNPRIGELALEYCTSNDQQYCRRKAQGAIILPPVVSARLHTKNNFTFRYGTVEVKAKLPRGDWLVPELWLEPVNPSLEKVVIGVSKGNSGPTQYELEAGVLRNSDDTQPYLMTMRGSTPWTQGFHTFKLVWTPDHIRFFVDNNQIHQLPTKSFPFLSQEVYVSFGVHVGGYRDFPDKSFPNKPWNTNSDPKRFAKFLENKNTWYPTWRRDPTFQVEYVRITAL